MDEIVRLIDENLEYISHEIIEDSLIIHVVSKQKEVICPYCGQSSSRVHSTYKRSFQDLPVQGKKVTVKINNKKMFCENEDCKTATFAETFSFLAPKSKKSNRLIEKIINISLETSSVIAASLLRDGVVEIGKSTICNILKKKESLK
jgi:transposase